MTAGEIAVLCDFDGTITAADVAESILLEFASEGWWDVEERYRAGEIGTREAIQLQFALVSASRQELLRFVDRTADIDPSFRGFAAFCRQRGLHLGIVSDGLGFYIRRILDKECLDVPFAANEAVFNENGMKVEFPHGPAECAECGSCGTCKLQTVKELRSRGAWVAFVGDGHSDFWAAHGADHVFAKGALLTMCREENLPHTRYASFENIQQSLEERL